jgi:hypothetical protein
MKYVLFAATIFLIALSSSAQAPTGITSVQADNGRFMVQGTLTIHGSPAVIVFCNPDGSGAVCSISLDENAIRKIVGVPNPQK